MKTAMQQLIDIIDKGISALQESQIKERIILEGVKGEAENLIEAEKEQILDAFVAGSERGTGEIPFNAEQYYSQNFKPEP